MLDADCERLVFRIRAHHDGAVLPATDDDLEELIGFLAAEANHESNRRRQQRLDTAFKALSKAAQASGGPVTRMPLPRAGRRTSTAVVRRAGARAHPPPSPQRVPVVEGLFSASARTAPRENGEHDRLVPGDVKVGPLTGAAEIGEAIRNRDGAPIRGRHEA